MKNIQIAGISVLLLAAIGIGGYLYTIKKNTQNEFITPTPSENEEEAAEIYSAYLNIHLENDTVPQVKKLWPYLQELIALADEYDAKLTLHFSVGWAKYAINTEEVLEEIREWEKNGHELGLHHHGPAHADWDGYTNDPEAESDPKYVGTMEELMEIMNQLPSSGEMLSASMTDAEYDWMEGLIYRTYNEGSGTGPTPENMVGPPKAKTISGIAVTELGKMGFAIDHLTIQISLEDIEEAILEANEGEVIGIVLNDYTMENALDQVEELLKLLEELGVTTRTVTDILDDYPYSE